MVYAMGVSDVGEKCGVFGIIGEGLDAARITFFGLFALQHRGQESSGIVSSDGISLYRHAGMGLVAQVFDESAMGGLRGSCAIGHNRYSTARGSHVMHAQPTLVNDGTIAVAHNGNLPSTALLEDFLARKGISTEDMSDSRMIAEAIGVTVREGSDIASAMRSVFPLMTGSFALLVLTNEVMIALRDGYGIRPLSIGTLNGGYVVSSETCAFHTIGATFVRDIDAGEMVIFDGKRMVSEKVVLGVEKIDLFEFVYFARPDSHIRGRSVYAARVQFGVELAAETHALEADVVIPVPDTAIPVAVSYAAAAGIPFAMGLVKNRYIHRTFIAPEQHIRDQGVKLKLTALSEVMEGKRVIVIDDSIVRGTTSRQFTRMLFEAGAREVHFLVSSPPVRYPDFYGIDISRQRELIAAARTVEQIREYLGVTSLHFLSLEGTIRAVGLPKEQLCTSCFTGEYPLDIHERRADVVFGDPQEIARAYREL